MSRADDINDRAGRTKRFIRFMEGLAGNGPVTGQMAFKVAIISMQATPTKPAASLLVNLDDLPLYGCR